MRALSAARRAWSCRRRRYWYNVNAVSGTCSMAWSWSYCIDDCNCSLDNGLYKCKDQRINLL